MHLHLFDASGASRGVVNGLQITTINTFNQTVQQGLRVVNGLQIAITYTVLGIVDEADVVVNGSQIATINTAYCKW